MSLYGLSSEDMLGLLLLNRADVVKFRLKMFVSMAGSTRVLTIDLIELLAPVN
jgi:hypothetical protein